VSLMAHGNNEFWCVLSRISLAIGKLRLDLVVFFNMFDLRRAQRR